MANRETQSINPSVYPQETQVAWIAPTDWVDYAGLAIDAVERIHLETTMPEGKEKDNARLMNTLYTAIDVAFSAFPGAGGGGPALRTAMAVSHEAGVTAWKTVPANVKAEIIRQVAQGMNWSVNKTSQVINVMFSKSVERPGGELGRNTERAVEATGQKYGSKEAQIVKDSLGKIATKEGPAVAEDVALRLKQLTTNQIPNLKDELLRLQAQVNKLPSNTPKQQNIKNMFLNPIQSAINNIDHHLHPSDLIGALRDKLEIPVDRPWKPRQPPGTYSHEREVTNALNSLNNAKAVFNRGIPGITNTQSIQKNIKDLVDTIEKFRNPESYTKQAKLEQSQPVAVASATQTRNRSQTQRPITTNVDIASVLSTEFAPEVSDFEQLQQTYRQYAELVRPTLATGATQLNHDQAIAYALSRSGYTPAQRALIIAAGSDNIPGNRTQAHAYVQQTANWPEQRTQQPVQIAQRQQ
jgi:hypothetical protein